jgi:integrase
MTTRRGDHEGTYTQRADGSWQAKIRVHGQRVSGSGTSRRAALAAARARAALVGAQRSTLTVKGLVEEWSALAPSAVGLRSATHDQYRYLLRGRVVPLIGAVRVDRLTKRDVAQCFPVGTSVAASTLRSSYAALVRVLDYAVDRGLVAANVAREVKRPPQPQCRPSRQVSPEQVTKILVAASEDRLGIAVWLAFGCGLRRGEVLGLRWSDVDLERRELHVTGNVTRTSAGLVRGVPKTRRGLRVVPMPDQVVEALKAHRARQLTERLASPLWVDCGHVLTSEIGTILEPRKLSRSWRSWSRKAGIKDTGTHVGRHYAASTLLASGHASVADVAAALGHDPAVLLSVYAVAVAKGQRAAADHLGSTLVVAPETVDSAT